MSFEPSSLLEGRGGREVYEIAKACFGEVDLDAADRYAVVGEEREARLEGESPKKVTEDADMRVVYAEVGVRRMDVFRAASCVNRFRLCCFFDDSVVASMFSFRNVGRMPCSIVELSTTRDVFFSGVWFKQQV